MAPVNPDTVEYVTLVRVIEYYGPAKWVNDTLASSRVPLQGLREFPVGSYIRSGVIMWDKVAEMPSAPPGSQPPPIVTVPPGGASN